ncbi:hypothetical protein GC194_05800 [bacterium]|nr:hypothetical protein [bacterium]
MYKMDVNSWEKDEYNAFVLLYAAYADGELNEDEIAFIESLVGPEKAQAMDRFGSKLSDYECLSIIEDLRERHYPGEEGKQNLLDELKELFRTDGKYSQIEREILHTLRRVL